MTFKESQHLGGRDRWNLEFKSQPDQQSKLVLEQPGLHRETCLEKPRTRDFLVWLPRSEHSAPV